MTIAYDSCDSCVPTALKLLLRPFVAQSSNSWDVDSLTEQPCLWLAAHARSSLHAQSPSGGHLRFHTTMQNTSHKAQKLKANRFPRVYGVGVSALLVFECKIACFCVATWVFASCQIQSKLQTQICFQFPLCGLKQTFLPFKSVCLFHVEPLYFLYLQMFNSTETDCKRCERHITDFALWSFSLLTTTLLVYMVSQKLKRTHHYAMSCIFQIYVK